MAKIFVGTVLKDIPDERDFLTEKLIKDLRFSAVPLPDEYNPPTIIYNQGQTPQCAAYAGAGIKTDEEYAECGKLLTFDARWLYARAKEQDGIPDQPGTYTRVINDILLKQGIPILSKSSCPLSFLKPKPPEPTPDDIREKAYLNRIQAYYRILLSDLDELIKQIIFQFRSISAASMWYEEWNSARETFSEPKTPQTPHAYRLKGWKRNGWIIPNSWGKILWGIGGESVMPFSMFRDVVLPQGDVWKLVDFIGEIRQ